MSSRQHACHPQNNIVQELKQQKFVTCYTLGGHTNIAGGPDPGPGPPVGQPCPRYYTAYHTLYYTVYHTLYYTVYHILYYTVIPYPILYSIPYPILYSIPYPRYYIVYHTLDTI